MSKEEGRMDFGGRVVLVTGGGSGIGRAVALGFAAQGARVAVADLNAEAAEKVAAETPGKTHLAILMDVTDTASVRAGADRALSAFGKIDVLANVAGWDRIMPFVETDEALWDRIIAINLRGVVATCHAVLPHMIERGSGAIVNVASEAGRSGSSGEAVYSAAKGGVISFTKAVAREVARKGIRVNCVTPGLTDTALLQSMIAEGHGKLIDAIVRATPIQRLARPEEVAEVVLFAASDRASFITGQTIGVGGGLVM
ncbi:MAG: SDR family oxidoreductase [Acidobacteria bacterium]|nr:SDR family oxidoreductase [Acidobacteriota bacterium]